MKQFLSQRDVYQPINFVHKALEYKRGGFSAAPQLGLGKTLGLLFFNPSLRTRMSTQLAAAKLGLQTVVMNVGSEGWALEFGDDVVMNGQSVEHVKDAAAVMGRYCDILGIRCFPSLSDRDADYSEQVMEQFRKYAGVPIVSLESATLHPLQSLADIITMEEYKTKAHPKVVLAWAPHIKALPQAVPNSFAQWANVFTNQFTIACPPGYELAEAFKPAQGYEYNLDKAIADADFIYVKNWSSYSDYGKNPPVKGDWLLNEHRLLSNPSARIMHCLPVRRGLELSHDLLDGPRSLVLQQATNRITAAYAVLKEILEALK